MEPDSSDMEPQRATIKDVKAQHGSGVIGLVLEAKGKTFTVYGDNAPTVRAMMGIFGRDIVRGMTLNVDAVRGREIGYDLDDTGFLAYLTE